MKSILGLLFLLNLFHVRPTYGQGCSDAGFCSIDGMKTNSNELVAGSTTDSELYANTIKTGISVGNTRYDVLILSSYIGYMHQVSNQLAVSMKLDGQFRTGELTDVLGFSDLTLSTTYNFTSSFGVIVGGKIPLSDADRKYNEFSTPMAYQTSLGSYDAIVGAHYTHKNLFFALGWQQPLIQNSNRYTIGNFTEEELGATYLETNQFQRASDVLLRVSYTHKPKTRLKKYTFIYSLLPIYHIQNDKYTNSSGVVEEIDNSNGLTLNTNIVANYTISRTSALEFSLGFPLIAREVRPEGLSQFAVTVEYVKRF